MRIEIIAIRCTILKVKNMIKEMHMTCSRIIHLCGLTYKHTPSRHTIIHHVTHSRMSYMDQPILMDHISELMQDKLLRKHELGFKLGFYFILLPK